MAEFWGLKDVFDFSLYLRGIVVTIYAVAIFRINLSRIHGEHSPLDLIICIILGAILGRAILNNVPLLPSLIVTTIIILLYHFLVFLAFKSHRFGKYIKGDKIVIIKDGKYLKHNLKSCRITNNDVLQALRLQHGIEDIENIKTAILERCGQISFQMK